MSWSIRITLLYISFVALIVSLVIISSNNGEELVAKDYYAQELKYQERIDAMNNDAALPDGMSYSVNDKSIVFEAPESLANTTISGEIYFFSPAHSANDIKLPIHFFEGTQEVNKTVLQPGVYKVKIDYTANNKHYFHEGVVTIQ
jgi:hypothetical protein